METINSYPVFSTFTIREWKKLLNPEKYNIIILKNLQELVYNNKIFLYAYCIMDNHIHLIWKIKREHTPSEIQKTFLENIYKQIKKDLQINHRSSEIVRFNTKGRSYHFLKR